jgi:hypothetical protein
MRGYVGTFTAGLVGLPATSGGRGSTECGDLTGCRAALAAALPDPAADDEGTLGVTLAPLAGATVALLGLLGSA